MTNEEAIIHIETLRTVTKDIPKYSGKAIDEAIDMAIKALERADLEGYSSRLWKSAYERGKADAEQKWIPVSERLPEKEMNCLVTDSLGKVHASTFRHALDGRESYFSGCYCVIAWMPLPKPHQVESEDNE